MFSASSFWVASCTAVTIAWACLPSSPGSFAARRSRSILCKASTFSLTMSATWLHSLTLLLQPTAKAPQRRTAAAVLSCVFKGSLSSETPRRPPIATDHARARRQPPHIQWLTPSRRRAVGPLFGCAGGVFQSHDNAGGGHTNDSEP